MKHTIDTVRITKEGRDQLIKVRRNTGIDQWNILCRWAICASLREETPPLEAKGKTEGGVEIQWKTLVGNWGDIFQSLVQLRMLSDGFKQDQDGFTQAFRAHLHRGLSYVASGTDTKSIADFVERWIGQKLN